MHATITIRNRTSSTIPVSAGVKVLANQQVTVELRPLQRLEDLLPKLTQLAESGLIDFSYSAGPQLHSLAPVDPVWYPPNNQNDTGVTGVGNGAAAGMIMTLASPGARLFGENIGNETEVEVIPTSAPSGTTGGVVTVGSGDFGDLTVTYVPPSGLTPGYLLVVADGGIDVDGTFWVRARNPGGNWVPYPIQFITGGG